MTGRMGEGMTIHLLESLRSVLYDPPELKICLSSAYRGARVDAVRRRENHTGNIGSKEILMLKRVFFILLAAVSVVALSDCGGKEEAEEETATTSTAAKTTATTSAAPPAAAPAAGGATVTGKVTFAGTAPAGEQI